MLSARVRNYLTAATGQDLPFAVWRRPGEKAFEGAISCRPMDRREVFGEAGGQPFFALARFDADKANLADAIAADILIEDDRITFFDGEGYRPMPSGTVQEQLRARAEANPPHRPLQAGSAPAPAATGQADYKRLVERTVKAIRSGRFMKIVLSRSEARAMPAGYDLADLFVALAVKYPDAFVSLVVAPGLGAWLVASPESLIRFADGAVRTMALAGTQWAKGNCPPADITWPDKIIEEQALVARYIRDAFGKCGIEPITETGPLTVRAANLYHLRSAFSAQLDPQRRTALPELLERLHPTSAVCGMPKAEAMAYLCSSEGYERGYYTGFLGPVGIGGTTDLFVNLRSAQIIGDRMHLYVGGGIVAASDPQVEWDETVQKTWTIGSIL